jgi:hypothetical protein
MAEMLDTRTDPAMLGDLADPLESFINGDLGFDDLAPDLQAHVRKYLPGFASS